MKKICLGLIGLISGLGVASATCSSPRCVIPEVEYSEIADGVFALTNGMSIGYIDESLEPAAKYLAALIEPSTGYRIEVLCGEGCITLSVDSMMTKDAYELTVDVNSVGIKGESYGGVIAGIESLRQLLPPQIESRQLVDSVGWTVPCVTIVDSPKFAWRGLMLDVSRHFHSKEEVMRLLDLMAMYKMNKFHWHLTDDQGWRVEIKRYPLLTEKGAWRKFNSQDRDCMNRRAEQDNPDFDFPSDRLRIVDGDTLYGGYYTQDDIREIVEFARIRGIDIVPEIDMPGHMLAAVSNYAGVSCFDDTGWGKAFSSPVCPGKDSAMEFCRNVYSELIDLFPGQYIHVGGDEVEKVRWAQCEDCQRRMREYGIETLEGLQSWFVHQIEELINSRGRRMVGWDEIVGGGLSPTATVMWWRSWSPEAPLEALKQGNEVILSPNAQFYLDYAEDKNSLRNIYDFDTSCGLDSGEISKILGVQCNLWSEWVPSEARLQYMAVPRLLAVAELGWSRSENMDFADFRSRLASQFERLNIMGVNYHIPELEGFNTVNAFVEKGSAKAFCLDPTAIIRYTTDGGRPTHESSRYAGEIPLEESTDFKFATFRPNGKRGDVMSTRYVKEPYSKPMDVDRMEQGLTVKWHDFTGDRCAEIEKYPEKGIYYTEGVEIPKEAKGNIGLVIRGFIVVPEDDVYTFDLMSDDGSVLMVDGSLLVDNDGAHSPVQLLSQKALGAGAHPIEVRYFDQNGGMLRLIVTDSSGRELLPADIFRR